MAEFLAGLGVADVGEGGGLEGEAVGHDGGLHACGVDEGHGLLGEGEGGHEDAALAGELQGCVVGTVTGEDEVLVLAVLVEDDVEVAAGDSFEELPVGDMEGTVATHGHRDGDGLVKALQVEVAVGIQGLYLDALGEGDGLLLGVDVGVSDVIVTAHGALAELLEADGLAALAALEGDITLAGAAGVVLVEVQLVAAFHLLAVHPVGLGDGVFEVEGGGDDDGGVLVGGGVAAGATHHPHGTALHQRQAQGGSAILQADDGVAGFELGVALDLHTDVVAVGGDGAPVFVDGGGVGTGGAEHDVMCGATGREYEV